MSKQVISVGADIIDLVIAKFANARTAVADAIALLYEVYKSDAWEGRYSSWSEFCEDGLQISKSLGSQYVAVYAYYVEGAGLTVEQIRETDIGKLYMALQTPGSPDEKYANALTLTRGELRQIAIEEKGPCKHENTAMVCVDCHARL